MTDAIANAYRGPNESPKDSRTSLAGIRQANQGVFVILPRDQASGISEESQPAKVVRVVTTVEYFLR